MDALDILGGLLGGGRSHSGQSGGGQSSGGGGFGGRMLEELIKAGMGRSSAPTPEPSRQSSRGGSVSHRPIDINSEVSRLEDLLGVAKGGRSSGQSGGSNQSMAGQRSTPAPGHYRQPPTQTTGRSIPQQPSPQADQARYQPTGPQSSSANFPSSSFPSSQTSSQQVTTEDEAIVLIRAMINAAKSDGKLDNQEQQAILSQVPNDEATINFLRQEFAQPLDVRDFTWNVPLGMEVQVYTLSLAAIQVDTRAEMNYLKELAHGLRLDPELCNQIHARYGLQPLY